MGRGKGLGGEVEEESRFIYALDNFYQNGQFLFQKTYFDIFNSMIKHENIIING